ncbi:hypothetical protein BDR04DRAFT_189019 [Suillus decipiens]|nr:hypothetical protein BDR04DRAFT_189019 [Suillus decipiens]
MSAHMTSSSIARATHPSHRTVNRVLRLSRLTGSVVRKPLESGRPRLLTAADASYLLSCIKRSPDLLLSEL